jgi:thymidine kinase
MICDEVQFYSPAQIDQAADVVDRLGLDVYLFGILTDFRGRLFPASARAVELADEVVQMPVGTFCWCGAKGTHHARLLEGRMVGDGDMIVVGDIETGTEVGHSNGAQVTYEVLCRKHHRMMAPDPHGQATSSRASATRS